VVEWTGESIFVAVLAPLVREKTPGKIDLSMYTYYKKQTERSHRFTHVRTHARTDERTYARTLLGRISDEKEWAGYLYERINDWMDFPTERII